MEAKIDQKSKVSNVQWIPRDRPTHSGRLCRSRECLDVIRPNFPYLTILSAEFDRVDNIEFNGYKATLGGWQMKNKVSSNLLVDVDVEK